MIFGLSLLAYLPHQLQTTVFEESHDLSQKEITPERFAAFLRWLSPDEQSAGDAYERLRFRLVTYFSGRQCLHPEELADETINRLCLKIGEEEIANKTAFAYGFARFVLLEYLRRRRVEVNVDEIDIAAAVADETEPDNGCLAKCLGELPEESRRLVLDYFSETKSAKISLHKRMAERFTGSTTALRMRIVRIKQRLRVCLEECAAA